MSTTRHRGSEGNARPKGEARWRPLARFWLLLLLPAAANLAALFAGLFAGLFVALVATYPGHDRLLFSAAFGGWAALTVLLSRSFLRETGLSGSYLRVLPRGMAAGAVLVVVLGSVVLGEAQR